MSARQPKCRHGATGYVTNQPDGYDPDHAHASTYSCSRPECVEDAKRWVRRTTGDEATFKAFGGAK